MAIVGGGPAGLAVAIEAARRGLQTVVLESSPRPPDKACGEGLMPSGVAWLEAAGVRAALSPADCAPFAGVEWIEQDGSRTVGRLPSPGGLGIRRTALATALARRAAECGAELRFGCPARRHERRADEVVVETDGGPLRAALLVAADGLHSPIRRAAGLDRPVARGRRFGLRRHFLVAPWTRAVEVHLRPGVQAFATPAGERRVGVAFLWEAGAAQVEPNFEAMLALFPRLAERVGGAPPDSEPRGAGPLAQGCRSAVADRLVLVGDAAGYVDAITGEGIALAFGCAAVLGGLLPQALSRGATQASLAPYAAAFARAFRHYEFHARALLALARRPRLRRAACRAVGLVPGAVDGLMRLALA